MPHMHGHLRTFVLAVLKPLPRVLPYTSSNATSQAPVHWLCPLPALPPPPLALPTSFIPAVFIHTLSAAQILVVLPTYLLTICHFPLEFKLCDNGDFDLLVAIFQGHKQCWGVNNGWLSLWLLDFHLRRQQAERQFAEEARRSLKAALCPERCQAAVTQPVCSPGCSHQERGGDTGLWEGQAGEGWPATDHSSAPPVDRRVLTGPKKG